MENQLIKIASTQGVWAALSVVLIFYILKTQEKRDLKQEKREANYQHIIQALTDKLDAINNISNDIKEIKKNVLKNNNE